MVGGGQLAIPVLFRKGILFRNVGLASSEPLLLMYTYIWGGGRRFGQQERACLAPDWSQMKSYLSVFDSLTLQTHHFLSELSYLVLIILFLQPEKQELGMEVRKRPLALVGFGHEEAVVASREIYCKEKLSEKGDDMGMYFVVQQVCLLLQQCLPWTPLLPPSDHPPISFLVATFRTISGNLGL